MEHSATTHHVAAPGPLGLPLAQAGRKASLLFISRVTLPPGERGNACYSLDCVTALTLGGLTVHTLVTEGAVRTPELWDMPPTPEETELARRTIAELRPSAVLVNYSYLAELLRFAPAGCARGVLAHDARHLRHADFLTQGLRFESSPWTEAQERGALSLADFVVAIQGEEAAEFARLAPHAAVLTAPCSFAATPLPRAEKPDACLFVGSDADHNLHGMHWFLDKVWPEVLKSRPTASLRVCGSIARRLRSGLPGVEILGRVEDLTPHYRHAAVGVVPIIAGSGLKLKLVECLAMGRPAVSTATGLAGLDDGPGVLLARDAAGFRDALLRLFADAALAEGLGLAGQDLVRRRFSREACYGPLLDYLAAARRTEGA